MDSEVAEHARWYRVLRLVISFGVIELGLLLVAYLSPAMRVLMRPVYVAVAIAFLLALRAATRQRHGDRRHTDRRHSVES
jgi:hypothetical protein